MKKIFLQVAVLATLFAAHGAASAQPLVGGHREHARSSYAHTYPSHAGQHLFAPGYSGHNGETSHVYGGQMYDGGLHAAPRSSYGHHTFSHGHYAIPPHGDGNYLPNQGNAHHLPHRRTHH